VALALGGCAAAPTPVDYLKGEWTCALSTETGSETVSDASFDGEIFRLLGSDYDVFIAADSLAANGFTIALPAAASDGQHLIEVDSAYGSGTYAVTKQGDALRIVVPVELASNETTLDCTKVH